MLKYKVNILAELKKAGYPTTRIRRERLLAEGTVQKIREGKIAMTLESLGVIGDILEGQPGDLVEWVRDEELNP